MLLIGFEKVLVAAETGREDRQERSGWKLSMNRRGDRR